MGEEDRSLSLSETKKTHHRTLPPGVVLSIMRVRVRFPDAGTFAAALRLRARARERCTPDARHDVDVARRVGVGGGRAAVLRRGVADSESDSEIGKARRVAAATSGRTRTLRPASRLPAGSTTRDPFSDAPRLSFAPREDPHVVAGVSTGCSYNFAGSGRSTSRVKFCADAQFNFHRGYTGQGRGSRVKGTRATRGDGGGVGGGEPPSSGDGGGRACRAPSSVNSPTRGNNRRGINIQRILTRGPAAARWGRGGRGGARRPSSLKPSPSQELWTSGASAGQPPWSSRWSRPWRPCPPPHSRQKVRFQRRIRVTVGLYFLSPVVRRQK